MSEITVVDYLIKRLEELGITDIFGLPGDFNFNIIEGIERNKNTNWIGCTNELNAGYVADGYARVKGYGALVTTFGVGELSAINAIAGSFAEYIPVIKIVGTPSTKNISQKTLLHHNFANPDYYAFKNTYSNVVQTTAYLNEKNAKTEIDRVLSIFINEKEPVYIAIPEDICSVKINDIPCIQKMTSNPDMLDRVIEHIIKMLSKAKKPIVIADILAERFEAHDNLINFLKKSQYPAVNLLMGKGLLNWDYKGYLGTYLGKYGNKIAYNTVNNSDCVITIGAIYSDLNTFGFDYNFEPTSMIDIEGTYTTVEYIRYDNVLMKDVLSKLSKIVPAYKNEYPEVLPQNLIKETGENKPLESKFIYSKIQDFIKEDDIIFSETGLVEFGFATLELPKGAHLYNQVLWGSIGWATPAAFGANIAERNKRVILVTGDGSHQLTAQEVSSMMRYGVKPIIIVINNSGYTIERALCKNPMDLFNNIASWNYSKLPDVFNGKSWSIKVGTEQELHEALINAEQEQKDKLCYIEICTDKMDMPKLAQDLISKSLAKV